MRGAPAIRGDGGATGRSRHDCVAARAEAEPGGTGGDLVRTSGDAARAMNADTHSPARDAASAAALELIEPGMTIGLGSGRALWRVVERIGVMDPDVIENHNLHGFDLPFLARRARWLGVPLSLGRAGAPGLRT